MHLAHADVLDGPATLSQGRFEIRINEAHSHSFSPQEESSRTLPGSIYENHLLPSVFQ